MHRGIYHTGWKAVTRRGNPLWVVTEAQPPLGDDVWGLYGTTEHSAQAPDLAKKMPGSLTSSSDCSSSRHRSTASSRSTIGGPNARTRTSLAGRPDIVRGRTHSLFAEMRRIEENADINIRNKSHSVIAEIELSASGAKGIDVAQGGGMSGWNAAMALDVDGEVGEGRIGRTHAPLFSTDERLEVSCDLGDPVYEDDEPRGNAFNGKVKWMRIDIDAAAQDADHLIAPEKRFRVVMARR